jgi:hypothetical protein
MSDKNITELIEQLAESNRQHGIVIFGDEKTGYKGLIQRQNEDDIFKKDIAKKQDELSRAVIDLVTIKDKMFLFFENLFSFRNLGRLIGGIIILSMAIGLFSGVSTGSSRVVNIIISFLEKIL